jgi:type II secretory pathway pseudopilin PulG
MLLQPSGCAPTRRPGAANFAPEKGCTPRTEGLFSNTRAAPWLLVLNRRGRPWWRRNHPRLPAHTCRRKAEQMKTKLSESPGFTLVEVMLVVGRVGLLATIAFPNIVRARTQSQVQACINNLRQIDDAAQQWGLENNRPATSPVTFPDIQPCIKSSVICPAAGSGATFASRLVLPARINALPASSRPRPTPLPSPRPTGWPSSSAAPPAAALPSVPAGRDRTRVHHAPGAASGS